MSFFALGFTVKMAEIIKTDRPERSLHFVTKISYTDNRLTSSFLPIIRLVFRNAGCQNDVL